MKTIIAIVLAFFLCGCESRFTFRSSPSSGDNSDKCWPILLSQSAGSIRCWSGGRLVYQNSIYHNGGVLCSAAGKQIDIEGDQSLCVIESSQANAWNPPTPKEIIK